jgi:hypothetical protein
MSFLPAKPALVLGLILCSTSNGTLESVGDDSIQFGCTERVRKHGVGRSV